MADGLTFVPPEIRQKPREQTRTNVMQMDARIAELVARLTALERERTEIVAEINTLRSARSGKTAAIKVVPSARAASIWDAGFAPTQTQVGTR